MSSSLQSSSVSSAAAPVCMFFSCVKIHEQQGLLTTQTDAAEGLDSDLEAGKYSGPSAATQIY